METSSVDMDKLLSKNFFLWIQYPKISLLLFKDGVYKHSEIEGKHKERTRGLYKDLGNEKMRETERERERER